jgi:hypothetical protein
MKEGVVMKHYKECNGFKVLQTVYILNYYDIEEAMILDIYDDKYSDDEDFLCKWVKTDKGPEHLEDIYETEHQTRLAIQGKKDAYDRYVTSRY